MEKVIEIHNLVKVYPKKGKAKGGATAVNGISFAVQKGEIFGLLGPNGAGKTTTLEIIEGLNAQTSGTVTVLGLDNLTQTEEIKRRIGIQLQSSQYLHHLTLGELLDLFTSLYVQTQTDADNNADGRGRKQLLELVNLSDKENAEVKDLSGGQKQRFTIATSLVHNPEILFLDEPTTGLDPKARRDMWQLIKTLNRRGITIVLTTHFMEEAEFLCHRVGIIDSGKILVIEEPAKLIDNLSKTTQVSFLTSEKVTDDILKLLPNIEKIYNDFPKIILELNSLENVSLIPKILKQNNIAFFGFTLKTASLEDVYLDLTGKEYEE